MRKIARLRRYQTLLVLLFTIFVNEAHAGQQLQGIRMSVTPQSISVALHEPIVVTVSIQNELNESLAGIFSTSGLALIVTRPDGITIQASGLNVTRPYTYATPLDGDTSPVKLSLGGLET